MGQLAAVLVGALALAACSDDRRGGRAAVGEPAPAYEAVRLSGEPVTLASLRGRPVLLNVWATWCGPCREEIPYLGQLHAAEPELEVVGVSIDTAADREKVNALVDALGIDYTVWLDPDERIGAVFRTNGVPSSMLIDRDGALRWRHVGVLRATAPGFQRALDDVLER